VFHIRVLRKVVRCNGVISFHHIYLQKLLINLLMYVTETYGRPG